VFCVRVKAGLLALLGQLPAPFLRMDEHIVRVAQFLSRASLTLPNRNWSWDFAEDVKKQDLTSKKQLFSIP
jgi:hypothetical protein